MASHHLRKYGVATTIDFELYELDGTDLVTNAVSATGDIKIMKDEGDEATLAADAFVDEGTGYSLAVGATEMEAARIAIYVVDQSSPKIWLDKVLIIETYGNASAQHPFDLGTAATAMRGTDSAALASAWTAALATALANYTATRAGYLDNLSVGAVALEATLTAIKGSGWSDETLKAIKAAIDAIGGDATAANQTRIIQILTGKWEITGNQLIMYDSDGTTVLYTFDLTRDDTATEFNPNKRTLV